MSLDLIFGEKISKKSTRKKTKPRKKIEKALLLIKKDIPKIVVPYDGKLIHIGPLKKEEIISLDKKLARELLDRLGYDYIEEIYIK